VTRLYLILTLGLLTLGAVHTLVALQRLWPLSAYGVWFLSGGITMLLTAALNFLNRAYGRTAAPGIRPTAVGANLLMFSSSILGGLATHATRLQLVVVLALTGGLTLLSFSRRALC
jgi:glucose uptake protein GlcU